jgi:cell division protein FtsX
MRLVGASCSYIQAPFIMEAAFAGLIGGTTVRRTHRVHARHRRSSGIAAVPASG